LSSSALLGGTRVTRLSASSFFQLIVVAYHKQLGLVQYPRQKLHVEQRAPDAGDTANQVICSLFPYNEQYIHCSLLTKNRLYSFVEVAP
jgi:hypothetical protein